MKLAEIPELQAASPAEKIALIDELWASIPRESLTLAPFSSRRAVAAVKLDPSRALTPAGARDRIRARTGI